MLYNSSDEKVIKVCLALTVQVEYVAGKDESTVHL